MPPVRYDQHPPRTAPPLFLPASLSPLSPVYATPREASAPRKPNLGDDMARSEDEYGKLLTPSFRSARPRPVRRDGPPARPCAAPSVWLQRPQRHRARSGAVAAALPGRRAELRLPATAVTHHLSSSPPSLHCSTV
ncbi:unnamed protein product [Chondrus crispus]|uniref:Uncharacterized protein n=1 Tax=Chondrus crispus TaxID=2769 RepID=R7QRV2_CHOCR|nr:unnamed protein product [Chondrus crispus]CDF40869.1 unnamed protein product [Chondrus crispus]|eukprot:XP_005711163.1 unnamed protein product [Chondrus crispus]